LGFATTTTGMMGSSTFFAFRALGRPPDKPLRASIFDDLGPLAMRFLAGPRVAGLPVGRFALCYRYG
jgi:hypothetical protein